MSKLYSKVKISDEVRICEYVTGDITLEDTNDYAIVIILTIDEQKALLAWLQEKFSEDKP